MPEQIIEIMKGLYYDCGLSKGEVKYNVQLYKTEEASMELVVTMDKYSTKSQQFYLYYNGDAVCPYAEKTADLIAKDEFFKTEMIPQYGNGLMYLGF